MEGITFRPIDPTSDFPALAQLLNKVRSQKVTAEGLLEWGKIEPPERVKRISVAESAEGPFAGYSQLYHRPGAADGRLYFDVAVEPTWRRKGLGTTLFNDAIQAALAYKATILDVDVYDNCQYCLRFAQKRGFTIDRHMFESTLDLRAFEPTRFDGLLRSVEESGIRFFSLAEAGDGEEIRRQLYDVNYRVSLDSPGSHGTFPSYEEFSGYVFTASWFLAEGQILAAEGEKIIGLSATGYFADSNSMENLITGVLPAYRGRKIAQALKLVVLRFAKSYGAESIRTHNDAQNEPMLAINRKLGYEPQVGEYRMTRQLLPRPLHRIPS